MNTLNLEILQQNGVWTSKIWETAPVEILILGKFHEWLSLKFVDILDKIEDKII